MSGRVNPSGRRRRRVLVLALVAARAAVRPRSRSAAPPAAADVRTTDGVGLHVEVDGRRDAPVTVVFVHGYGASTAEWRYQRAALAPHARLVLFDQRGHGRSGWGRPWCATVDQLGEDLLAVLRAHAQHRPVVLVSHSLGGMAVLALARSHPELFGASVRGVALVSTSAGHLMESGLPARAARALRRTRVPTGLLCLLWVVAPALDRLSPFTTAAGRDLLRSKLFSAQDAAPADVESARADFAATPLSVLAAFAPSMLHHDRADGVDALLGVPVVLVSGTDDATIPPSHSCRLHRELGGRSDLVLVEGAGHMVNVTRPEPVSAALERLLDEVGRLPPRDDR